MLRSPLSISKPTLQKVTEVGENVWHRNFWPRGCPDREKSSSKSLGVPDGCFVLEWTIVQTSVNVTGTSKREECVTEVRVTVWIRRCDFFWRKRVYNGVSKFLPLGVWQTSPRPIFLTEFFTCFSGQRTEETGIRGYLSLIVFVEDYVTFRNTTEYSTLHVSLLPCFSVLDV